MNTKIDLAIIGAGIAGVSAAVYARRSGINFIIFEAGLVGGQLFFMEQVDNYAGLAMGTKGAVLAVQLSKTLDELQITPCKEYISRLEVEGNCTKLYCAGATYEANGAIIATGASFKKIAVPGEDTFLGKGVSYCAVCDGFFFKGKDVCVVGGGNTAVEEALYLSNLCRRVILVHRRDALRALTYLKEELSRKDNIEVIYSSVVNEIKGADFLEEVIIENTQSQKISSLCVSGIFVAIGINPNTEIAKGIVSLDENGFIITDEQMKTSRDFIWSAGDCRKRPLRQLITAASEGAIAALSAYKYIKGYYISA